MTLKYCLPMFLLVGCQVSLDLPASAQLSCATSADCVGDQVCDSATQRCIAAERPLLRVESPTAQAGRYTRQVPFTVQVVSANAQVRFNLALEFAVVVDDDAPLTWYPVTLAATSAPVLGVAGSPSGSSYILVWDALTDALIGRGLDLARVDLDGNGQISDPVVRAANVKLRARAQSEDNKLRGDLSESPTFAIGNTPPTAALTSAIGESGVITVVIGLTDISSDRCGFELQFRGPDDGVWRAAALAFGNTDGLNCRSGTALDAVVGWDSSKAYISAGGVAADPSQANVPQGIGSITLPSQIYPARLQLRARAFDEPEAQQAERHWGVFSTPLVLPRVMNQSSPQIVSVSAGRANSVGGTSPIHIRYRLADAQADAVDVTFEFSSDAGAHWLPCQEYPYIFSEGTRGLVTAPLGGDGQGGVEHVFTWDPSGTQLVASNSTLLRVTATDNLGAATTFETGLGYPAGPTVGLLRAAQDLQVHEQGGLVASYLTSLVAADFNGDGVDELVVAKAGDTTLSVLRGSDVDATWTETYLAGTAVWLWAADFTGDGVVDLLGVDDNGTARVWRNNGSGAFTLNTTFSVVQPTGIVVADFDNDNDADLLVMGDGGGSNYPLVAYVNTGVSGDLFGAASFSTTRPYDFDLVSADFDVDGVVDLAILNGDSVGEVWRGNGDGTFDTNPMAIFSGRTSYSDDLLAVANLNGDGVPDLVNINGSEVQVAVGVLANGELSYQEFVYEVGSGANQHVVQTYDLDRDGLDDILSFSDTFGGLEVLLTRVDADGMPMYTRVATPPVSVGSLMVLPEIDGQPGREMILTDHAGVLHMYRLDTPPVIAPTPLRQARSYNGIGIAVLDQFDADGVPDLLFLEQNAKLHRGQGSVGTGEGTFGEGEQQVFVSPDPNASLVTARAGDINGDGLLDIVYLAQDFSTFEHGYLGWTLAKPVFGVADGKFLSPETIDVAEGIAGGLPFELVDVDLDGLLDVVMLIIPDMGASESSLAVAFNRGGVFTQVDSQYPLNDYATQLIVKDLNYDNKPDVAVLQANGELLFLWANSGSTLRSNAFPTNNTRSTASAMQVELGDFDWDGTVDLLEATYAITLTEGLVGGGFGTATTMYPNASYGHLVRMDVTHDGISDVLLSAYNGSQATTAMYATKTLGGAPTRVLGEPPTFTALPPFETRPIQRDLNCDGATDLILRGNNGPVQVMNGTRDLTVPSLHSIVLAPDVQSQSSLVAHVNLVQVMPHYAWHPQSSLPCEGSLPWEDELAEGRVALGTAGRYRPLSTPWLGGDVTHFKQERIEGDVRWVRNSRFYTELDLNTVDAPRGLILSVPLPKPMRDTLVAANVRVFLQRVQMTTAQDKVADALHNHPNAANILPKTVTARGVTHVIGRQKTWEEVPKDNDGNWQTGQGRRFVYNAGRGTVDILTNSGGLYFVLEEL